MILKSIQLQGFKSFPDKTEIRFLGGITAIVGPNGSGKSNISDAIRWVLGEQSSRSLRGAKMEDVIFGGTARRGPQGFAEVSLVLNNESGVFRSEYLEIMVTRRYYRSGESEYFLGKKRCRLRDIHELFMDTGLGKDGYSAIGQGRIDEILSLKSEDRREIFEEAAGITKFRYRKEEAARKLAATEENLVRIRDLYTELENRREPLEKQAEKAKAYLLLRDETRVLEVSLWLRELDGMAQAMEKAAADTAACAAQLADTTLERDRLYEQIEALAAAMRQAEVEAETLRTQLHDAEQRQAEGRSRMAVLEETIRNAEENQARAAQEQAQQTAQAADLEEQLLSRRRRLAALEEEENALARRLDAGAEEEARRQAAVETAQAAQAAAARALDGARQAGFACELAETAARTALESMDSRRGTMESDLSESEAALKQEEEQASEYRKGLDECRAVLAGVKNKLAGAALKADSRRGKVETLTAQAAEQAAKAAALSSRIHTLTELQREYEGFSRAVKLVMAQSEKGGLHGVRGPVSSLIAAEPRFITAIETALGAAGSNLVVDTAEDAKRAIGWLKRQDGGRATFLPVDTIKPAALREQGLAQARGFVGTADQLVSCKDAYRNIISNLLARTAVTQTLDDAMALARAHGHRFRVVTLDGQVVQAGGAMTGGSAAKSSGVLARGEQLRQLTEEEAALSRARQETAQQLAHAKEELAAVEYDVRAIEAERARAQEDEAALTARQKQHALLLDSLRMRYEGLRQEQHDLGRARASYQEEIDRQAAKRAEAAAETAALTEALARCQAETGQAQAALAALAGELSALRTQQAEKRTARESEQRALGELLQVQRGMESGAADAGARVQAFLQQRESAQNELQQTAQRLTQEKQDSEALRQQLKQVSEKRLALEGEKTKAERDCQRQNEQILALEREHTRLEGRTEQLKTEQTRIHEKMWEAYELTPTPARAVAVPLDDITAAQARVQALRGQMRALGNVNLDAADEYAALMERYTFLGQQKDDLERAQEELYRVIDQLTVRMKEIFASEFAKLNAYFGETFREIFGGGHASLQLADTGDILNCGIDIMVCPPGKAVKTLTLLSGGEKAFVAIALYFAILKLRPTPFCVLDEIEAALDDVNVGRFAAYLQRLADKTQFIVITHRRGTMECADMLYGVTMQEQGVSRLLMLNLAEAEKQLGKQLR